MTRVVKRPKDSRQVRRQKERASKGAFPTLQLTNYDPESKVYEMNGEREKARRVAQATS